MKKVVITVELEESDAWAFAEFLKRSTRNTYAQHSTGEFETACMVDAAVELIEAFKKQGVAPR